MNKLMLPWALLLCAAGAHAVDCGDEHFASLALERVNAFRAEARSCGRGARLPAAPQLEWHAQLLQAAQGHAQDMAARNLLSHASANGQGADARLAQTGYAASLWAENVQRASADLDAAIAGWRNSPAHCRNLMLAPARHMALACAQPASGAQRYWVLLLAAPL